MPGPGLPVPVGLGRAGGRGGRCAGGPGAGPILRGNGSPNLNLENRREQARVSKSAHLEPRTQCYVGPWASAGESRSGAPARRVRKNEVFKVYDIHTIMRS